MNTASLYSCVMYGRGISDDSTCIARALDTIREFAADDGKQFIYRKFIAPSSGTVRFAKAQNRSVTGSMNDDIHAAKFMLEDDMAPSDIGYRLNETPMSALNGPDGRKYGFPKDVLWIEWAMSDVEVKIDGEFSPPGTYAVCLRFRGVMNRNRYPARRWTGCYRIGQFFATIGRSQRLDSPGNGTPRTFFTYRTRQNW